MRYTLLTLAGIALGALLTVTGLHTWRHILLHALSRGD